MPSPMGRVWLAFGACHDGELTSLLAQVQPKKQQLALCYIGRIATGGSYILAVLKLLNIAAHSGSEQLGYKLTTILNTQPCYHSRRTFNSNCF